MNWWANATRDERLAQIDGGIECGMTMAQVATNCRTKAANVAFYAQKYERSFRRGKPRIPHETVFDKSQQPLKDSVLNELDF